jgi:adenylate kinase family enzyme
MIPKTFIFIGRSGCGKGTQAQLLEKFLVEKSPGILVVHLETGKLFREFIKGKTYTHDLSRAIYESGGLQPDFLAVHLWSDFFVLEMKKDVHLIIDGTPRKLHESKILHTAFEFYKCEKPQVILLNVSRKWSEDRMLARKRVDDNKRDIAARLNWFDTEVTPAIDFYRDNSFYDFHDIDGERTIGEIHSDIVKRVGLV